MDTTSIEDFSAQLRALKPQMESVVKQKGKQLKAVIANQRHFDEQMSIIINKYSNILIKYFTECGVHVDYLEDPTVDFFYDNSDDPEHLHLYDYDIILLITSFSFKSFKYFQGFYFFKSIYEFFLQTDYLVLNRILIYSNN